MFFTILRASAVLLLLCSNLSHAYTNDVLSSSELKISGFMSAVGSKNNVDSTYLMNERITDEIDFLHETKLGLQFDVVVSDKLLFTTQLLADQQGEDEFSVKADWIYAKFKLHEYVDVRAGRLRIPSFMLSDFIEVGYAFPWVRPPMEVYQLIPVNSYNGVDLLINLPIADYNLVLQPFFGNAKVEATSFTTTKNVTLVANKARGGVLSLVSDFHTLRFGYFTANIEFEGETLYAYLDATKMEFYSTGLKLNFGSFDFDMEFAVRDIDDNGLKVRQEGMYLTFGNRFGIYYPHITLANLNSDSDPFLFSTNSMFEDEQDSITLGLKTDITRNTVLKIDVTRVELKNDTKGLFQTPLDEGQDDANIFSVGIDLMF